MLAWWRFFLRPGATGMRPLLTDAGRLSTRWSAALQHVRTKLDLACQDAGCSKRITCQRSLQ